MQQGFASSGEGRGGFCEKRPEVAPMSDRDSSKMDPTLAKSEPIRVVAPLG